MREENEEIYLFDTNAFQVTILTVGFGDIVANNDAGRGLVFPYSVGGIIILGLVISSISRFSKEIGHDKIIRKHLNRRRVMTVGRSVSTSLEFRRRTTIHDNARPEISKLSPADRTITYADDHHEHPAKANHSNGNSEKPLRRSGSDMSRGGVIKRVRSMSNKPKIYLLREEKDRFDCMRRIQAGTARYRRWYALTLSIIAFGLLWCVGAVVFWQVEQKEQGMSYFEALCKSLPKPKPPFPYFPPLFLLYRYRYNLINGKKQTSATSPS